MHGHLKVKLREQLFFKGVTIDKADKMSRNVGKKLSIHAA